MVFQTVNTASPSTDLALGRNITSGDVNLGDFVDTGSISIGSSCTTGDISIGFSSAKSGNTIIGHQSSSQDIELRTLTGDLFVGSTQTSGNVNIGTSASRTGDITIGSTGNTGDIILQTTSGASSLYSGMITAVGGGTSTINLLGHLQTTGRTDICVSQSTGILNIGTNPSRSGKINIGGGTSDIEISTTGETNFGDSSSTVTLGNVSQVSTINIGNGQISGTINIGNSVGRTGDISVGQTTSSADINLKTRTGDISLGVNQTTGVINLGTGASRTSDITVGNSSNTGDINLLAANYIKGTWTPVLYDESKSDTATITINNANYCRFGNMVHLNARLSVTSKGSLTSTERILLGGIPFNIQAEGWRPAGVFIGSSFEGSTYTQINPIFHDGIYGTDVMAFIGMDYPNSENADILWSDLVLNKTFGISVWYIV